MAEKKKHIITEELLYRYFTDEVSSVEKDYIIEWKDHSKNNLKQFERLELLFKDLRAVRNAGLENPLYNVEKGWAKFMAQHHTGNRMMHIVQSFMKVAAVILVAVGAGWFVYQSNSIEKNVAQGETINALEARQVSLVDGSQIAMQKGSQITYNEGYGKSHRNIQLKGEAFFDVMPNQQLPFVIQNNEVQVTVLGTSFNVNGSSINEVVVAVETGRVEMSVDSEQEILLPGQKGIYNRKTRRLQKIESETLDLDLPATPKPLSFEDITIAEVLSKLQTVHGQSINMSDSSIGRCQITIELGHLSLEDALDAIASRLRLVWSRQADGYLLAGKGC